MITFLHKGKNDFNIENQNVKVRVYNLGRKIFKQAPKGQFSGFYHENMSFSHPLPPSLYACCLLTKAILPQHCTMEEGIREGEIQFHHKTEFFQNIVSQTVDGDLR